MTTMIERMARAISRLEYGHEGEWEHWAPTALEVLKALRSPTESMISSGSAESRLGETLIADGRLVMIWQAMIDQAIKEGEQ